MQEKQGKKKGVARMVRNMNNESRTEKATIKAALTVLKELGCSARGSGIDEFSSTPPPKVKPLRRKKSAAMISRGHNPALNNPSLAGSRESRTAGHATGQRLEANALGRAKSVLDLIRHQGAIGPRPPYARRVRFHARNIEGRKAPEPSRDSIVLGKTGKTADRLLVCNRAEPTNTGDCYDTRITASR